MPANIARPALALRLPRATLPLCLGFTLGLAGCGGSLFQTKAPPPTIYVLRPDGVAAAAAPTSVASAPGAAASPHALTGSPGSPAHGALGAAQVSPADLAVLKPKAIAGLETERIAALYPDRHLDYFANARWSGPLDEMLQGLAVQVIQARGHWRNVSGDASVFASAYWLEIQVSDFQAEYAAGAPAAPTIHVHLSGRLGRSSDRKSLGRFEAEVRQPAADNRMTAIVEAYERAADAALLQIDARAVEALAAESETR